MYAVGDIANIPDPDGKPYPQLGSLALQAGRWAANNILADIDGQPRSDFRYKDKGIMAMIGRNAAVAEVGPNRRELHGVVAFASWLGVHAWLLSGFRERVGRALRMGMGLRGPHSWLGDHRSSRRRAHRLGLTSAGQRACL